VYDSVGICHVVVPQHGHIRPGMFCVGGDSHSPTGGAFGAYMFGIGSTEMLGVVTTGEIWVQVPRTIRMRWYGRLHTGVTAKDMMLAMIARFGMNRGAYQAVEFCGEDGAWFDGPGSVMFNGSSAGFTSTLGSQSGCSDYGIATGTIMLSAGLNTLSASISGNGTWDATEYYSAPSFEPALVDLTPHNGQYRNVGLCAVGCFDVTAGYSMPSYVSMDVPRSTGLLYSSATVTGRHTVIADIRDPSQTSASYLSLRLKKSGEVNFVTLTNDSTEMFVTNFGGWQRVALQFDDATLATGSYYYTLIVRSHWPSEVQETLVPLRILVVNERDHLQQLVKRDRDRRYLCAVFDHDAVLR
jgi:3-isopropylmalate/(R)-2-methylmalate dehydratase large subunit